MGRIAANTDKPKGYEPSVDYRYSCDAAELSCRFASLPTGQARRVCRLWEAGVRGVGKHKIHCAPGRKGAR